MLVVTPNLGIHSAYPVGEFCILVEASLNPPLVSYRSLDSSSSVPPPPNLNSCKHPSSSLFGCKRSPAFCVLIIGIGSISCKPLAIRCPCSRSIWRKRAGCNRQLCLIVEECWISSGGECHPNRKLMLDSRDCRFSLLRERKGGSMKSKTKTKAFPRNIFPYASTRSIPPPDDVEREGITRGLVY